MTDLERERFRVLMMKALDGELAESEQPEFEYFLRDPVCNQEWRQYSIIQEASMSLERKTLPAEQWENYWNGVYNRLERGIAWLIITIGSILLGCWLLFEAATALWADSDVPIIIKIGIVSIATGILLLLFSVIRERFFLSKTDKYKEVIR